MDAFVSLVEVAGETIACMDAIVSLTEAAGETIACVHAFVSGGGRVQRRLPTSLPSAG
ncbi:MAG TPA: hypothetical protein H9801_03310 [Candidatus Collinsella stercoripullorum]|nr:hypothetical protein [Candidatus Collinsella stercoripullorum]